MWRKYVLYFLLLNFLNTAIISAETVDANPFDGIEQKAQEEFNTVIEYFVEGVLGNKDATPDDEDDDTPEELKFEKQTEACVTYHTDIELTVFVEKVTYSTFYLSKANTFAPEVLSPPPKQV